MRAEVTIEAVWSQIPKTLIVLVNCGGECPDSCNSEKLTKLEASFKTTCEAAWRRVQLARVYEAALQPSVN